MANCRSAVIPSIALLAVALMSASSSSLVPFASAFVVAPRKLAPSVRLCSAVAVHLRMAEDGEELLVANDERDKTSSSSNSDSGDTDHDEEEHAVALERATRAMTAFSNKYVSNTSTKYCTDMSVPAVVIKGLAEHKVKLGSPLCPCRYYEDKEREAKDGYWNCPCVPMRERHECHCMLFLTEENEFAGERTEISFDEVVDLSGGVQM